ncbi:MAG: agmatine deiminase family protein [Pseudomonadota bacterium]
MSKIRVLPEWVPQACLWVGWPSDRDLWEDDLAGAQREVAGLVNAISDRLPVRLVASTVEAAETAKNQCFGHVTVRILPMGDIWLRDTGPIYAVHNHQPVGLTFAFNGWGGKYDLPGDRETASAMLGVDRFAAKPHSFVLEGGAVDQDGTGTLLTTRQCLLNPNRNPAWTEADGEAALKSAFGATRIIWLTEGLAGDHTDGHIDNIARFVAPGRVVCQQPTGRDDPNADVYLAIEAGLRDTGLSVITIPSPGRIESADGVAAASHLNFVFANGRLIVPVYDEAIGARAVAALQASLPQFEVIGQPSNAILTGGGSFHCISQQIPADLFDVEDAP